MPTSLDVRCTALADPEVRLFKHLRIYCACAAIAVVILACGVLLGWAFDIAILKSVVPGLVTIKVNTALGLAFSAISLWLLLPGPLRARTGYIARFLALLVALIGLATLAEYIFSVNLRIDELFIGDPLGSTVRLRRDARPNYGIGICGARLGAAAAGLDDVAWPAACAGAEFVGRVDRDDGHLQLPLSRERVIQDLDVHADRDSHRVRAAAHEQRNFLRAASRRNRGRSDDGGFGKRDGAPISTRRFLDSNFPGMDRVAGTAGGDDGKELNAAICATSNIFVFAVLVWLSARKMNVEYGQRHKAENEILELNADLEIRVAERTDSLERRPSFSPSKQRCWTWPRTPLSCATWATVFHFGAAEPSSCTAGHPIWR